MRREVLTESRSRVLELSDEQADALRRLGRRLASDRVWWGDETPPTHRSVIQCVPEGRNQWTVRVPDAVGVIAVDGLQIEIHPKIPIQHVLYLFGQSGHFPRLADTVIGTQADWSLWELVARWYVLEAERVLRSDLIRDYEHEEDWLRIVRGRVDIHETASAYYRGQIEMLCEYEEFKSDTALNRILREAARRVALSPLLPWPIRRRALSVVSRMEGVGDLHGEDLASSLDRRTVSYATAVSLASQVIQGQGRTVAGGEHHGQTFLIRTPEMVEAGLRSVLRGHLQDRWSIEKQGRQLRNSTMSFNPDLVINHGLAVADVKYKLTSNDWDRGDLYQILAFATAFHSTSAGMLSFVRGDRPLVNHLQVGDIDVHRFFWDARDDTEAEESARTLSCQFASWLDNVSVRV